MLRSSIFQLLKRVHCLFGNHVFDARVSIGQGTYGLGSNTILLFRDDDSVVIGKYCSIAFGVTIIASGEHNYRGVSNYPFLAMVNQDPERDTYSKGNVFIGNDVWLGANSTILSGTHISDGAVVAAGAVVRGTVPPYAIVGGVPARVIKYRFSAEVIDQLLHIRWWNWPEDFIRNNLHLFYLPVRDFLHQASAIK